jgi:hypothetical protein
MARRYFSFYDGSTGAARFARFAQKRPRSRRNGKGLELESKPTLAEKQGESVGTPRCGRFCSLGR